MPDIGDLLDTAAHAPRSPLDLATVERRAGVLRRRQQALLGAPALVLVLVVSAVVLTKGPGTPDELREAEGGTVTAEPGPSAPTLAPGSSARPSPGTDGRPADDVTVESSAPRSASSSTGARSVSRPPAPTPTAYPSAPSCRVTTVGLAAGQTRTCSFTATHEGGYRVVAAHPGNFVAGDHWVDVTRTGVTTRYGNESSVNEHCASDVIEPGDLVTVGVHRTAGNVMEFEMAAGDGYHCYSYPESASPSAAPQGPTAGG